MKNPRQAAYRAKHRAAYQNMKQVAAFLARIFRERQSADGLFLSKADLVELFKLLSA